MLGTISRLLMAGLGLLLLTSCGSSSPGQLTNLVMPSVKTTVTGGGVAFGAAFAMINATLGPLSMESLSTSIPDVNFSTQSLTDVGDGLYLGMLTDIDSAGNTTLKLPDPDDIPAATLVPAADAFLAINSAADCSVAAEPASVEMSANVFSLLGLPGFVGLIMGPAGTVELGFGVVSDQALDTDSPPADFVAYQWIYSDGEAVVSFEGTDCGAYSASEVVFREGWNFVGWHVVDIYAVDASAELVNAEEPETLFLNIDSPVTVAPASSDH